MCCVAVTPPAGGKVRRRQSVDGMHVCTVVTTLLADVLSPYCLWHSSFLIVFCSVVAVPVCTTCLALSAAPSPVSISDLSFYSRSLYVQTSMHVPHQVLLSV